MTEQDIKELEEQWKNWTSQAVLAGRINGTTPGWFEEIINNELQTERLPWHVYLRDFVERCARNDYNFNRPNRIHMQRDIVLPTLINDELRECVIVTDTSASTSEVVNEFVGQASDILETFDTLAHVMQCDTRIVYDEDFTRLDLPIGELPVRGHGGTDLRPPFEVVTERGWTPSCLIYLTDTDGPFPDYEPDYPVMWVVWAPWYDDKTIDEKIPFGQWVRFRKDER